MGSIGNLDQRITLQEKVRVSDGSGGWLKEWQPLVGNATVWADVLALAGGESNQDGGVNASGRYKVTIRNRDDFSEAGRMIWNGGAYNIRNIRRNGSREMFLVFEAERGAAT